MLKISSRQSKASGLSRSAEYKIAFAALVALSTVIFGGKSHENLLRGIDSNIHAKAALSVTSKGWAIPNLPIADSNSTVAKPEYFNDHPYFLFWVNGIVMRILGPSTWSARVVTTAFSVGCVLLTLSLGTTLYSRAFGFISALFLLFSRDIILTGATVSLDPPMLFFILLSFLLWIKEKWMWMGVAAGVGLWIKTPVVLLVFPTAFIYAVLRGKVHQDLRKIGQALGIALGVGSLVWIMTGLVGGWHWVQDYWIRQVWGTAIGGRGMTTLGAPKNIDPWSVFKMLRMGYLIGLPFLFVGLMRILLKTIKREKWNSKAAIISIIAFGVVAVSITPMRFRMDYYFNPIFPFLAFLSAYSIADVVETIENKFYAVFSGLVLLLLGFLLSTPTRFGPEAFVALKHFIPFIQSYGVCQDEVLIVSGGEPVGSSHDYGLVLNFYTGHPVQIQSCTTAEATLSGLSGKKSKPKWVLLSKESLLHCISPQERAKYSTQLKVGDQYLLTDLISQSPVVDLSVLERELQPSVDCRPPEYPKDIYHIGF